MNAPAKETRLNKRALAAVIAFVLLWTALSTLAWTGHLKPLTAQLGQGVGKVAIMPLMLTTWPAHEVTLMQAGKGSGANAMSSPANVSTGLIFLAWCVILWSPLFLLARRGFPTWLTCILQSGALLVVSAFFWLFGNG